MVSSLLDRDGLMHPFAPRWIRAYAIAAIAIGLLFLTLGLLSICSVYFGTSGTTRIQGTVKSVEVPVNSTDSVHLVVEAGDGHVVRVATSSEVAGDFHPGKRTAILVKKGQEPIQDEGSGRYTGSVIAVSAGLIPLAGGLGIWRSREQLTRKSMKKTAGAPPT